MIDFLDFCLKVKLKLVKFIIEFKNIFEVKLNKKIKNSGKTFFRFETEREHFFSECIFQCFY